MRMLGIIAPEGFMLLLTLQFDPLAPNQVFLYNHLMLKWAFMVMFLFTWLLCELQRGGIQ